MSGSSRARSTQGLAPGTAKPPRNPGVAALGAVWAGAAFRNRSITTATTSTTGTPRSNNTTAISRPPPAIAPSNTSESFTASHNPLATSNTPKRFPIPIAPAHISAIPPVSTMAAQAATIDPTKAAKYPIILSDALLGKPSKETYTGVRYNHKPTLSSDTAPGTARLKQSAKDGVFNLGFEDQGDKYQYSGTRTSEDGKYVLIFDPARKAFILHRVDSLFHMNLTKTPTDSSVESLRKQFPHLEVTNTTETTTTTAPTKQSKAKAVAADKTATGGKAAPSKATGKAKASKETPAASKAKATKNTKATAAAKKSNAGVSLTLPSADTPASKAATPLALPTAPTPAETKKSRRPKSPVDSEEDDDDDDDLGLTIEYPGGPPSNSTFMDSAHAFSPAFPSTERRFSEFVRTQGQEEEEDADGDPDFDYEVEDNGFAADEEGEGDEDMEMEDVVGPFKLPSPANNNNTGGPGISQRPLPPVETVPVEAPDRFVFEDESDADEGGEEMVDVDLDEDELLKDFQGLEGAESDSSVSEEE